MNLQRRIEKLEAASSARNDIHVIRVKLTESYEDKAAEYCEEHGLDLNRFNNGDYGIAVVTTQYNK